MVSICIVIYSLPQARWRVLIKCHNTVMMMLAFGTKFSAGGGAVVVFACSLPRVLLNSCRHTKCWLLLLVHSSRLLLQTSLHDCILVWPISMYYVHVHMYGCVYVRCKLFFFLCDMDFVVVL